MTARALGVQSALSDLPDSVVVFFSLVTQLGDVWFLLGVTTLAYWVGPQLPRVSETLDRRRTAVVLGTVVAGLVAVTVAKELFALPRPPGAGHAPQTGLVPTALWPLYEWLSTGSGYGFPSGHAIGSTVVFGGLAWAVHAGRFRARVALATGLVAVVSLSRLVLGLHYLVDVLAGIGLGLVVLAVAIALRDPLRVFAFAAVLGAVGLAFAGSIADLVSLTGVAVGATLGWSIFEDALDDLQTPGGELGRSATRPSAKRAATAVALIGAVLLGPLLVLGEVVVVSSPVAAGSVAFIGGLAVVAMPLVGDRVAKRVAAQN